MGSSCVLELSFIILHVCPLADGRVDGGLTGLNTLVLPTKSSHVRASVFISSSSSSPAGPSPQLSVTLLPAPPLIQFVCADLEISF
uniref:Secreted protein n=1 Tax=Knipowitschia caucasica TaxID=637954 RepID=A0AAV2K6F7_KNICA